ncbi:MAG: hypothetical protein EA365_14000 [Gloeocapsa sp. DLM2.Bin57]|nr:MAG: hypothetical protein EA365_14000 [Gloeocapsa sp. DLM2.Bin57]
MDRLLKFLGLFLLLLTTNLAASKQAWANQDVIVDAGMEQEDVEMRSGPGDDYELVETVPDGTIVMLCDDCTPEELTQEDANGCEWYSVALMDEEVSGFIRGDFLYKRYFGNLAENCSTSS